ncbi:MAG: mycofactocin biosynthesis peptidyl-dipeptidase MftE [Lapillicoccus sp.]
MTPAPTTRPSFELGLTTSPGATVGEPLLLVPVGSTEQHGPHLPLATDTMVAAAVSRAAAEMLGARGTTVLVAPPVAYGASGEHEGFPGTVSIGHEALMNLLIEFGRSACRWARGLIFVNGHGGNVQSVRQSVELLRYEGRPVAWTSCDLPGADAHAGHTETSLLLELSPHSVHTDLFAAGPVAPLAELLPRLRREGVRAVSPSGVLGDPSRATALEGRALFQTLVRNLVLELQTLDVRDDGRLSPSGVAQPVASR